MKAIRHFGIVVSDIEKYGRAKVTFCYNPNDIPVELVEELN